MRVLGLLALLAACGDDGPDPITVIDAPRMLALLGDRVLDVDGEVTLTPFVVDPAGPRTGDPVELRACSPWIFIADPATCAGANALPIAPGEDGRFTLSTAQLLEAFPPPDGSSLDAQSLGVAIAAGLEPRIPVIAEVSVDGATLVARRDLAIVEDASELRNPVLEAVRFDGEATRTLAAGREYALTLTFDPASFDPRPDEPELERYDCYFYSPHGVLSDHELDVREPEQGVETPPNRFTTGEPGDSWLFLVITDLTEGMTAEAIPLTIE